LSGEQWDTISKKAESPVKSRKPHFFKITFLDLRLTNSI
jgi:hypothetical protein